MTESPCHLPTHGSLPVCRVGVNFRFKLKDTKPSTKRRLFLCSHTPLLRILPPMSPETWYADLHTHTIDSYDCSTPLDNVIEGCLANGVNCLGVTDHDTIELALELAERAPFPVIVGEEITAREGQIMGYFLHEVIPPGLSTEETIAAIHEQGGLVCMPHPFCRLIPSRTKESVTRALVDQIDIFEVANARNPLSRDDRRAVEFAERHNKPVSAGSDSHRACEFGRTGVELPPFETPMEFLESLRQGRIVVRAKTSFVWGIITNEWSRTKKRLRFFNKTKPRA